jgi:hypothetical protein
MEGEAVQDKTRRVSMIRLRCLDSPLSLPSDAHEAAEAILARLVARALIAERWPTPLLGLSPSSDFRITVARSDRG